MYCFHTINRILNKFQIMAFTGAVPKKLSLIECFRLMAYIELSSTVIDKIEL